MCVYYLHGFSTKKENVRIVVEKRSLLNRFLTCKVSCVQKKIRPFFRNCSDTFEYNITKDLGSIEYYMAFFNKFSSNLFLYCSKVYSFVEIQLWKTNHSWNNRKSMDKINCQGQFNYFADDSSQQFSLSVLIKQANTYLYSTMKGNRYGIEEVHNFPRVLSLKQLYKDTT